LGAYTRHLDPEAHTASKHHTQKIERKHLTLRTRIKRLVRKTICFSKTTQMHDIVIGLFVNRYAFGRAVSMWAISTFETLPPLERRSYWDLIQKYGKQAELPKAKRRFHALRHAIAVHLLDAGADVAFVQDRLGHANIQNTMVYMRYTTVTRDAQTRQLCASHRVV